MDGIIHEIVDWLKTRDPKLIMSTAHDIANIYWQNVKICLWVDMEDGSVTLFKYHGEKITTASNDVEMSVVELNNPNSFENIYDVINEWLTTSQELHRKMLTNTQQLL